MDTYPNLTVTAEPLPVSAVGDIVIYNVPEAEYMYGCVPTALGMLLGYYDYNGYEGYSFDNLFAGTISLDSRGSDNNIFNMNEFNSVLGSGIASKRFVEEFYETTPQQELQYTFVGGGTQIDTSRWDCLADYLGTGYYWRGSEDLSTWVYSDMTFRESQTVLSKETTQYTSDGITRTVNKTYTEMANGIIRYVEASGYTLDLDASGTFSVDTNGGSFTFEDYKAQIDAGRPVLIMITGHAMTGYGYNASTREIIFDDCYYKGQRLKWGGSYYYSGAYRRLEAITVVAFDTSNMGSAGTDLQFSAPENWSDALVISTQPGTTRDAPYFSSDDTLYLDFSVWNSGKSLAEQFTVTVKVDDVAVKTFTFTNLKAGGTRNQFDYELAPLSAGTHTIELVVKLTSADESDTANNIYTRTITISDGPVPAKPVVTADITELTNRNVTVTATFPDDGGTNYYRINNGSWRIYTEPIVVGENATLDFRTVSSTGVEGATATYLVTNIDRVPPQKPVVEASTTLATPQPVTLSATFARDSVRNEYSLDGNTWLEYTGKVVVKENATVYFRSFDAAGNSSTQEYTVSNITSAPDQEPDRPGTVTAGSAVNKYNVTLSWNVPSAAARISGYQVKFNDSIVSSAKNSYTIRNLAVGSYTYSIRAYDSAGRFGDWSSQQSFTVTDVTSPTLGKVTAVIDGYTGIISWSGSDNVGIVRYEVSCAGQTRSVTAATAQFENLAVGKYDAEVRAFDAAGNVSKTAKVKITVKDATPPEEVTGLAKPAVDSKYSGLLSWNPGVDNSGKVASYLIELDGKLLKSNKNSLKVSKLSVGEHTYRVRAVDKDKNTGAWSEMQTFTVGDMTPPKAGKIGVEIDGYSAKFLLSGTDNSGVIAKYIVICGDKRVETTGSSATLADFGVGKQTAFVTAIDAAGNESKPVKVNFNIKDATPPEMVTGLAEPVADEKYKAQLSWDPGVDNSGKVASYLIEFDGKTLKSNKNTLSVSRLSVGEHTYRVSAVDKDKNVGTWSDWCTFTVADVTAPGKTSVKSAVDGDTLNLFWKAAKDNVGIAGYTLRYGADLENVREFGPDQLAALLTDLNPGACFYELTAFDAAGNRSAAASGKALISSPVSDPLAFACPVTLFEPDADQKRPLSLLA